MAFNSEGASFDVTLWSEKAAGITFSPNPAGREGIWCQSGNTVSRESIRIVDSNGVPVHLFELEPGDVVRLEPALFKAPGVYFWKARNSGETGSFIITH